MIYSKLKQVEQKLIFDLKYYQLSHDQRECISWIRQMTHYAQKKERCYALFDEYEASPIKDTIFIKHWVDVGSIAKDLGWTRRKAKYVLDSLVDKGIHKKYLYKHLNYYQWSDLYYLIYNDYDKKQGFTLTYGYKENTPLESTKIKFRKAAKEKYNKFRRTVKFGCYDRDIVNNIDIKNNVLEYYDCMMKKEHHQKFIANAMIIEGKARFIILKSQIIKSLRLGKNDRSNRIKIDRWNEYLVKNGLMETMTICYDEAIDKMRLVKGIFNKNNMQTYKVLDVQFTDEQKEIVCVDYRRIIKVTNLCNIERIKSYNLGFIAFLKIEIVMSNFIKSIQTFTEKDLLKMFHSLLHYVPQNNNNMFPISAENVPQVNIKRDQIQTVDEVKKNREIKKTDLPEANPISSPLIFNKFQEPRDTIAEGVKPNITSVELREEEDPRNCQENITNQKYVPFTSLTPEEESERKIKNVEILGKLKTIYLAHLLTYYIWRREWDELTECQKKVCIEEASILKNYENGGMDEIKYLKINMVEELLEKEGVYSYKKALEIKNLQSEAIFNVKRIRESTKSDSIEEDIHLSQIELEPDEYETVLVYDNNFNGYKYENKKIDKSTDMFAVSVGERYMRRKKSGR